MSDRNLSRSNERIVLDTKNHIPNSGLKSIDRNEFQENQSFEIQRNQNLSSENGELVEF